MFKLTQKAEFTHKVPVSLPCDDGYETVELRTRFRVLSKADFMRLGQPTTLDEQTEFLNAVVVRFEDVVDDDGKPINDVDELKQQLIDQPAVRLALQMHYGTAIIGGRRGN